MSQTSQSSSPSSPAANSVPQTITNQPVAGGTTFIQTPNPFVQKAEPFDQKYPLANNPVNLTLAQKELLWSQIRTSPVCGPSELEFALLRIEQGVSSLLLTKAVERIIEAHRQLFYGGVLGRIAPALAAVAKSPEEWQRISHDSEEAAKRSLIAGAAITKLDALQAEAVKAQEAAESAKRELDATYREFQSIPGKVAAIQNRLGVIKAEPERNNLEALLEDFRKAYSHWFLTGQQANFNDAEVATAITLAAEKLAVLDKLEKELLTQIDSLKKHSKSLAKKIGTNDHHYAN